MRSERGKDSPDGRRWRVLGALLLGCACAGAGCAMLKGPVAERLPSQYTVRRDMLQIRSDSQVGDDDPRIVELAELRQEVRSRLELPEQRRPVTVYLFRDELRYTQYMETKYPNLPARRAFFIGTPGELAVYAYWGEQVREDLRHEYTHGLLHSSLQQVPLWLDEGLAEYFEVVPGAAGRINQDHADGLAEMLLHGWKPDLRRLERLEDVSEMQRADYQEAWAWAHFLLHESDASRDLLLGYLEELRSPVSPPLFAERLTAEMPRAEDRLTAYITSALEAGIGRATVSADR
ncbi:MAG: DUF1570 domain-containing protein [Planctomycetaceae bacterium]|nr:DUF1570 domain-containing protein [Planctomycetaceae bacterium]